MNTMKNLLKITAFALLFALCFFAVGSLFHTGGVYGNVYLPSAMKSVFSAPGGSLDGVYIGSSVVYSYWVPTAVWENRGWAIQTLSIPGMPPQSILPLLQDMRKTQPDALYIISLNSLHTTTVHEGTLHELMDFLPLPTRLRMLNRMWNTSEEVQGIRQLELLLPFLRFHPDWQNIHVNTLNGTYTDVKGSYVAQSFLHGWPDVSGAYHPILEEAPLNDDQQALLDELLAYVKEEKVNVLFTLAPEIITDTHHAQLNNVARQVEEAGFPMLNLMDKAADIGLDMAKDYSDEKHTNIHGALLFTRCITDYIDAHYELEDKRGQAGYEDWDEAAEIYGTDIARVIVDHEWALAARDNTLAEPKLVSLTVGALGAELTWGAVDGAETYQIYRRKDGGPWERVNTVSAGKTAWTDVDRLVPGVYTYTVDAARTGEDGTALYSSFDRNGLAVKR